MHDDTSDHQCPTCRSDDVMRVPRRRAWDYVMRLFGWRVYRCARCLVRFYDRPSSTRSRIACVTLPGLLAIVAGLADAL